MASDVKLLPLPPRLAEYGETTRTMWQDYARACIEADRKERVGGGEAVAWMRRDATYTGVDGRRYGERIITDRKVYADDVPLYTHPAPDDVARLVEAAAQALRYVPEPTGSNVQRDWKKKQARDALAAAIAPFTAAQQEVQS